MPSTSATEAGTVEPVEVVPDALAPPPSHPRFALIDGLRAVAALTVLAVHVALMTNAFGTPVVGRLLAHLNIGVSIFFLISGFLLYRPFIAHRAAAGPAAPATRDYARRRILRIYPAYWFALAALVIVPGLTGVLGGQWLGMVALVHALPVYDTRACMDAPLGCGLAHTWSLVVELTFYAVLPLYVSGSERLSRGLSTRRWMQAQLVFLAILSVSSVMLRYGVSEPTLAKVVSGSFLGYIWWFALGMGTAVLSVGLGSAQPRPIRLIVTRPALSWSLAAAAYVGLCVWLPASPFLFDREQELGAHVAFGGVAALLLVPVVFRAGPSRVPHRLLENRYVAWLGLISYGIFLWHYAIAIELGSAGLDLPFGLALPATIVLTVCAAAVSYYVVERPALRLKHRGPRRAR